MNRRGVLKSLAGLALCPLCMPGGLRADDGTWSYEGERGPAKWGEIDAASKTCSIGTEQSPIDITDSIGANLPRLRFRWTRPATTIENNGHTIQLNFSEGSTLQSGSNVYALLQLHFHHPSEHLIGGKSFPMEAHFVHRNREGNLAVVGVLMTGGGTNAAFSKIVATMPKEKGSAPAQASIDIRKLLPARQSYYRYSGSLTTPPCSEVVDWHLLTTPIAVADADIAAFAKLYPRNARPVLGRNRRFVLRSG